MDKEKLEKLLLTDSDYKKTKLECESWFEEFKKDTSDDKIANAVGNYTKKVIGILTSMEEVLTGNYKEDELEEEFSPKKGDNFNLDSIPFTQTTLFSIHYRISLINREAHRVLNPSINFDEFKSPFHDVIDAFESEGQLDILSRGYIPQYVYDLELNIK